MPDKAHDKIDHLVSCPSSREEISQLVIRFYLDIEQTLSIRNNRNILSNYVKNVHSIACTTTTKIQTHHESIH